MAKGRKTGGRSRGTPNKITTEIRDITRGLFDDAYWTRTKQRLESGRIAPAVEARLLAYAFGEPKQTLDVPQLGDITALLAKKVIHELHPGPGKTSV